MDCTPARASDAFTNPRESATQPQWLGANGSLGSKGSIASMCPAPISRSALVIHSVDKPRNEPISTIHAGRVARMRSRSCRPWDGGKEAGRVMGSR